MTITRAVRRLAIVATLAMIAGLTMMAGSASGERPANAGESAVAKADVTYHVTGRDGRLIRTLNGEPETFVQGVPATPVDAFTWDGDGIEEVRGQVFIDVDPIANTGVIRAQWTDRNGHWKLTQQMFESPPHPTLREIGSDGTDTNLVDDAPNSDPVITNTYLHGNTGAAEPVLPTVFNLLATWGPAEVTLDGKPFVNEFDGLAPNWFAHFMVTEGVRDDFSGEVTANDGGDIYNPTFAGAGDTDRNDLEVHMTWHDAPGGAVAGNFPPIFDFFYHVQFEQVDIRIGD